MELVAVKEEEEEREEGKEDEEEEEDEEKEGERGKRGWGGRMEEEKETNVVYNFLMSKRLHCHILTAGI